MFYLKNGYQKIGFDTFSDTFDAFKFLMPPVGAQSFSPTCCIRKFVFRIDETPKYVMSLVIILVSRF